MKKFFLLGVFMLAGLFVKAQDPVFSQFYNAPVYLNPALIGDEENFLVQLSHRSQWRSLVFPYNTTQISMIAPLFYDKHRRPEGHFGGIGVSIYNDEAGEGDNFKTTGGNASFAYNLQFEEENTNRLTFAMQFGLINRRINEDVLQWGQQYDVTIPGYNEEIVPEDVDMIENSTLFDISAGTFWRYYASENTKKIRSVYAGFVASHLNNPDQSVIEGMRSYLPLIYRLHGGLVYGFTERISLSANLLTVLQDQENQTNIGAFASYMLPVQTSGKFSNLLTRVGTWYRWKDSFILNIDFLTDNFQLGFSYDWNVTSLKYNNNGAGAYEITLGYKFFQPAPPKVLY